MNKQELMKVQTCVLRVNIHCDGCKQKVKKTLPKVDGVYSVKIDSDQGKVTVSGNADPATLVKKLTKSGKHAELWGGGGQKGLPNNFQNQFNNEFMNMMQMGGKDSDKSQKGGLPPQFKGFKDLKGPLKDQKSVKFNLEDEHGEDDDEDDYSDDEDYSDEDYTDDEGYSDEDDGEDEFDPKHPPPKMMPFMNAKGQGQPVNEKMKGGGGGGSGNTVDMKAMMMMLNEKKGGEAGKGKKDKNKDSEDEEEDFDFEMPIKMGDGKNKEGKGKKSGGVMKSIGDLFGGQKKKSKGGSGESDKNKNDHHQHHGGNEGKTKIGSRGGGDNNGKMGKDHGINNGHGKGDSNKIDGGFRNINVNHGGMGHKMGGGYNLGQAGNFQVVQGHPAQGGMNPGYYPGMGMGAGNPNNHQQQQYMAMMLNQQQQQRAAMHGGEMYHSMMYGRPHPAVNYGNGSVPPMPPPSHANPHSHMFSDENTDSCSIM
ncbi:unnamed protein product [Rhodiola kirilowii]